LEGKGAKAGVYKKKRAQAFHRQYGKITRPTFLYLDEGKDTKEDRDYPVFLFPQGEKGK